MNGRIIWLAGRPSSGKSTLAHNLAIAFRKIGLSVVVLDGDQTRAWLTPDCDFTPEGRERNIRRTLKVARLIADAGVCVICAYVTPYTYLQKDVMQSGADLIVVDTPLDVCKLRDAKGLYEANTPDIEVFEIEYCQVYTVNGTLHPDVLCREVLWGITQCNTPCI